MAVMKDVAKLAGVSVSTVSFVLNGVAKQHKVSDQTAKKVLQAAKELGYKMNTAVESFEHVSKRRKTIAFFIPFEHSWLDVGAVTDSINKHMKKIGVCYNILLVPYEETCLMDKVNELDKTSYDAAVVDIENDVDLQQLENCDEKLPFVLYNRYSEKYCSVKCIADEVIEHTAAMIAAKGYKKITIISGKSRKKIGDDSLNIFLERCKKEGIEINEDLLISTENTLDGGAIAARRIINMEQKPELIICMNTTLAFGAIPLLARNGFVIPRDAELLCFGWASEIQHIANYIPALSMIAFPVDELTKESFELALRLASAEETSPVHYHCACKLILNESFTF